MDDQPLPSPRPTASPWSVEHYGFETPVAPPTSARQPAPSPSPAVVERRERRGPTRVRGLVVAAALTLGLTAGGAGAAAARAIANDGGDGGRGTVANVAFDRGPHQGRGGGR